MIKKLCTLLLLTCMTAAPSMAQRYSSSDDASFSPKKGQWQVSVLLGSGKFFNENTSYLLPKFSNDGGVVGLPNGGKDNSGDLPQESGFESTERAYDLKEMHRVVNALPKEYRVPFAMHVSGFKYREIAEKLNLPLGTVKSRIFFTRQKLQEELKDFR